MTSDEKTFITEQFSHLHEKLDLKINPLSDKVEKIEVIQGVHCEKIDILLLFKEGHQQQHAVTKQQTEEVKTGRRFMWEQFIAIIVGSGIIGFMVTKL